jgi:diadenosine tetraphosphate (Ap4A) HIT family hydrolase
MRLGACVFCDFTALAPIAQNELAFAIRDKFPVRPLHSLILPKRHAADIFETTLDEREAMHEIARKLREEIMREDTSVGGFNFGSNIGAVAGQKILALIALLVDMVPFRLPRGSWR